MLAATDLQPFFDAILAAPDDDAPRLRLAEALAAAGDPRGESIELACRIERMERDDPARLALAERLARLPRFYYFTPNPPWNNGFVARRGFVDEVQWTPAHFVAHGDALVRAAPVRTLSVLGGLRGDGALLAGAPALARLRKLVVPPVHGAGDDLVALGRSPFLAGLHTLRVDNLTLDRALLARVEGERVFPGLRALELVRCAVAPDAWPALHRLVEARNLAALDLTATRVPAAAEALLRARLGDRLTPRPAPRGTRPAELRARVRFGALDLSNDGLDAGAFAALLASGPYPEVGALVLGGNPIGDVGAAALARSGAFPSLTSLVLDGTGVTLAAARALAGATALDRLASVSLGEVVQTGPDGGLGDEDGAALELARSRSLPSLRRVQVAKKWRAYAEGAREEAVTQPVPRDDGAVVACVVRHWIWP